MNTQVTAKGMQVQAQAEGGIVISNQASGGDWKADAQATYNTSIALIPTSTADLTSWYHNKSDNAANARSHQESSTYTNCTATPNSVAVTSGVGVWTDSDAATHNIYLVNDFYIKSSAEAISNTRLYINKVTITGVTSTGSALDSSLRVAIKLDNSVYIFAPVDGGDTTYYVAGATTETTAIAAGVLNTPTSVTSIPASSSTPISAKIFCYFEGEDEDCKSNNLTTTLDGLTIEVTFGTTTVSS